MINDNLRSGGVNCRQDWWSGDLGTGSILFYLDLIIWKLFLNIISDWWGE